MDKFFYPGGFISQNAKIDDEVVVRVSKASASFERLQQSVSASGNSTFQ